MKARDNRQRLNAQLLGEFLLGVALGASQLCIGAQMLESCEPLQAVDETLWSTHVE